MPSRLAIRRRAPKPVLGTADRVIEAAGAHPGFARDSQRAFEQLVRLVRNAQDAGVVPKTPLDVAFDTTIERML